MDIQKEPIYYITKSNEQECRNELIKRYGNNCNVLYSENVIVPGGFLKLGKRGAVKLAYTLPHRIDVSRDNRLNNPVLSEDELFKQNRDEILKENSEKLINSQITKIANMNDELHELMSQMNSKIQKISQGSSEVHPSIHRIDELLEQNEFSYSYINMIEDKIRNSFSLDELEDFDLIQRRVVDWIGESISIAKEKVVRPPHIFIIVGPTGVGKTTTLVKLAAQFVNNYCISHDNEKPEIRFITTDIMRVGAMEQISRWCQRMETEVVKAERKDDLISIINDMKDDVDAIFIDTSGFSPNDAEHLAQVKTILDVPGLNPDVYLAVAASTKARDLHNIMKNYEPFGFSSVIVTKCDESEQLGNVISVINERHKSISYLTTGQFPRDIKKADVIHFLINLEGFEVDRVHIENLFGE